MGSRDSHTLHTLHAPLGHLPRDGRGGGTLRRGQPHHTHTTKAPGWDAHQVMDTRGVPRAEATHTTHTPHGPPGHPPRVDDTEKVPWIKTNHTTHTPHKPPGHLPRVDDAEEGPRTRATWRGPVDVGPLPSPGHTTTHADHHTHHKVTERGATAGTAAPGPPSVHTDCHAPAVPGALIRHPA